MKRHRGDRSHLWLQQQTEKLGLKVSRSGISQLENGNRTSISVAEWLILAAALEVPPLLLLWPRYPDGDAQLLPDLPASAIDGVNWASGRSTMKQVGPDQLALSNFPYSLIGLASQLTDHSYEAQLKFLEGLDGPNFSTFIELAIERRDKLTRQIEALGGEVDHYGSAEDDDDGSR